MKKFLSKPWVIGFLMGDIIFLVGHFFSSFNIFLILSWLVLPRFYYNLNLLDMRWLVLFLLNSLLYGFFGATLVHIFTKFKLDIKKKTDKIISRKSIVTTVIISFLISCFLIFFLANFSSIGYRSITIEGSGTCRGSDGGVVVDCGYDRHKAKLYTIFWFPIPENQREISFTSGTGVPLPFNSPYQALKYDERINESAFLYLYFYWAVLAVISTTLLTIIISNLRKFVSFKRR